MEEEYALSLGIVLSNVSIVQDHTFMEAVISLGQRKMTKRISNGILKLEIK